VIHAHERSYAWRRSGNEIGADTLRVKKLSK